MSNELIISCYNCHSNEYDPYDVENGFNLVKCKSCGLLYVNPRPSDEEISIANQTGIHKGEVTLDVTNSYNENAIPGYISMLSDFYKTAELKEKSWLDIGCGNGEFLKALLQFSNNAVSAKGTEPNKYKIQNALKHKLDVENIDLDTHSKQYDFISLLNVYSHLTNPLVTLKEWRKLIKDGGELLIETGHSCHLPSKYHLKPYLLPDHLSFANREILINILQEAGFEVLKTNIYRGGYYPRVRPVTILKQFVKWILGRKNYFHSYFPKFQHGDMFIRAKKVAL